MASNMEVFFLTQEVAELRKLVGGRAVDIEGILEGTKKQTKTFDDELRELKDEIKGLRKTVDTLEKELKNKKSDTEVVTAITAAVEAEKSAAEAEVSTIAGDLKASTDELENVLLVEEGKVKGKKK